MGNDGKMEANAEYILSARLYAKHAGTGGGVFNSSVGRIVCGVGATGDMFVLSGAVDDGACELASPGDLENEDSRLFATTLNAAYVAHTEGATPNASGTLLYQNLTTTRPLSGLSLPLRPYKPLGHGKAAWPVVALVFRTNETAPFHTQEFSNITEAGWFNMRFERPLLAGQYRLELWPSPRGPGGRAQGLFESPAWISSIDSEAHGGGGSRTFLPGTSVGGTSYPVLPTLGQRVVAAMTWQLGFSLTTDRPGVMKIPEANWRGVGRDDVGASSAMWDLIRSGYLDAWLNVRFLESMSATIEMQRAGLVETVLSTADLDSVKKSFVRVFGKDAESKGEEPSYLSWIGCDRVLGEGSSCDGVGGGAGLVPVDIEFVPALAAAAKLDIRGLGPLGSHPTAFDRVRDSARNVSGRFRTNNVPIESVNVSLWRASSRWERRTAAGFARREVGSGGDWQIFDPAEARDGYGQFGLTEENGGIVMSTTALVFEAGLYREAFEDFSSLVRVLTEATDQLERVVNGQVPSAPLLAANRSFLRARIAGGGSVPQQLCMEARRLSAGQNPRDRWGEHWCDYYKSVSWNLPGAGAFLFAFAKGLLALEFPLGGTRPTVEVWGALVSAGGGPTRVVLPSWATARWPPELIGRSIDVFGLNIAGKACDLSCTEEGDSQVRLTCTLEVAGGRRGEMVSTSTLAGAGEGCPGTPGLRDGAASQALFNLPSRVQVVTVDGHERLFVLDSHNGCVRSLPLGLAPDQTIVRSETACGNHSTLAHIGPDAKRPDGTSRGWKWVDGPLDFWVCKNASKIYVFDTYNGKLKVAMRTQGSKVGYGPWRTVAGSGAIGTADGPGERASFMQPHGMAVAEGAGFAYVSDTFASCIRSVHLDTGRVSTIAGTCGQGGHRDVAAGEASALSARFNHVHKVTVDPRNESVLYVSEVQCSQDGPLDLPDPCKTSYGGVAFTGIRRLDLRPDGSCASVRTVAGFFNASDPEQSPIGFADGPVVSAKFNYVHDVGMRPRATHESVEEESRVLIVMDDNNERIRRVDLASGTVTTLAGNGGTGCADGTAPRSTFNAVGLAVGRDGSVYIADYSNHRIRMLTIDSLTTEP